MKLLAASIVVILGIVGAGSVLDQQGKKKQAPAPIASAPVVVAEGPTKSGAWMWDDRKGSALDARKQTSQPVYSGPTRETTFSRSPGSTHGEWIEHDVRVTSQQALGLGGPKKR